MSEKPVKNLSTERMKRAHALIKENKYTEARAILVKLNNPTARKWVTKIDHMLLEEDDPFIESDPSPPSASPGVKVRYSSTWDKPKRDKDSEKEKKQQQAAIGCIVLIVIVVIITLIGNLTDPAKDVTDQQLRDAIWSVCSGSEGCDLLVDAYLTTPNLASGARDCYVKHWPGFPSLFDACIVEVLIASD